MGRNASQRDREPESRSGSGFAGQSDRASHAFHQPPADGQSKAGSTESPGGGAVRLGKCLKQVSAFGFPDPDAGVLDLEPDRQNLILRCQSRSPDDDAAPLGELDRITDKVEQDL